MTESTDVKRKSWGEAISAYFERRLIAILFMGFSSGLPLALTSGTLQIRQTEDKVDLTVIGFFVLAGVSYGLKFLWAPMIDRSPPPGPLAKLGHRRGWAILFQVLLMISIAVLGSIEPAQSPTLTAACAVLVAFLSASQDIVIDAYRIELLDEPQQAAGSAMTQYGYRVGMLASGAGALFIAEYVSWFAAYLVMAGLMTLGIVTILLTREPPIRRVIRGSSDDAGMALRIGAICAAAVAAILVFLAVYNGILAVLPKPAWIANIVATLVAAGTPVALFFMLPKPGPDGWYADLHAWLDDAVVEPFADMAKRPGWVAILLFIVLFNLGDAIASAFANAFYIEIGFTKPQIAEISKVFGLGATLVGVFLGGLINMRVGIGRALLIAGVLKMLGILMFAAQASQGANEHLLMATIGIDNLVIGLGSAAFVAYLSDLCNVAFTATQYALFSSLAAAGRVVLSSPFAAVAKEIGWANYFIMASAMALPGVILLIWMLQRYPIGARQTATAAAR
ncbi:MAG TPA: MFS transporter [Candidatus Binatia bacterium]|nr:MFS transporter [Candidatus Binatia bacterium]